MTSPFFGTGWTYNPIDNSDLLYYLYCLTYRIDIDNYL